MGNHSIDCDFCGRDQRLTGPNCCAQEEQRNTAAEDAHRSKQRALMERLDALGIRHDYGSGAMGMVKVYAEDLLAWLDSRPKTFWERL